MKLDNNLNSSLRHKYWRGNLLIAAVLVFPIIVGKTCKIAGTLLTYFVESYCSCSKRLYSCSILDIFFHQVSTLPLPCHLNELVYLGIKKKHSNRKDAFLFYLGNCSAVMVYSRLKIMSLNRELYNCSNHSGRLI